MSEEFDLFDNSEIDNLQEELANHSYEWTNKLSWVLVSILIFTGGISSGIWYSKKQATPSTINANSAAFQSGKSEKSGMARNLPNSGSRVGGQGSAQGFSPGLVGSIKKVDGDSLEIQTKDGAVLRISSNSETRVISTTAENFASLKVGDTISVVGAPEPDGSITSLVITKGELPTVNSQGGQSGAGKGNKENIGGNGGATQPSKKSGGNKPKKAGGKGGSGGGKNIQKGGGQTSQGTANSTSQNSGPSVGGQKPGGGGMNNPEFIACLAKEGVIIKEGERPDRQDPVVASALEKCRDLLPRRNGGGQGGNQGQGQNNAPAPVN